MPLIFLRRCFADHPRYTGKRRTIHRLSSISRGTAISISNIGLLRRCFSARSKALPKIGNGLAVRADHQSTSGNTCGISFNVITSACQAPAIAWRINVRLARGHLRETECPYKCCPTSSIVSPAPISKLFVTNHRKSAAPTSRQHRRPTHHISAEVTSVRTRFATPKVRWNKRFNSLSPHLFTGGIQRLFYLT